MLKIQWSGLDLTALCKPYKAQESSQIPSVAIHSFCGKSLLGQDLRVRALRALESSVDTCAGRAEPPAFSLLRSYSQQATSGTSSIALRSGTI
ncbi:hypothetical protein PM082_002030 [Marasmius tenuissimus]|nr:hypothetical protein PM082_002030 [Marasmius tenuissimus]